MYSTKGSDKAEWVVVTVYFGFEGIQIVCVVVLT